MKVAPRPIAVVLDGEPTPAWQQHALSGLLESPWLAVVELSFRPTARRGPIRRLHTAIERRLLVLGADPLAPVRVEELPIGASAHPEQATLVVWLSEQPVPEQESREVLYIRHGRRVESADDAVHRALLRGASGLETELLLKRAGATVVIERTVSGIRPFSITLSRDLMLWKLAVVVRRAAERAPGLELPALAHDRSGSAPSNLALMARSAVAWPRVLATRLFYRRPWLVRVRTRGPEPTAGWSNDEKLVRWTRGNVYADPFLFEHEGRHHLFCEEIPRGASHALISHTELQLDGSAADPPTAVIAEAHHISYPFVFAHGGEIFMIPEASEVERIDLYRAVEFPHVWQREKTLIDQIDAADATILDDGDRLWLFAAVAPPNASSLDELHLFWAEQPRGPWHAHPRNPIVSNARCARPAGAIQRWGTRLVRPGQDGSRRYGGAISFREIDVLSETDYAEHEIARLEPADIDKARAIHTYTANGRFEAIDLRRRELRLFGLMDRPPR
jgi:hypothetical protein